MAEKRDTGKKLCDTLAYYCNAYVRETGECVSRLKCPNQIDYDDMTKQVRHFYKWFVRSMYEMKRDTKNK